MSGDNFSDSMSGVRRVLGEITNLPAKRGASSDLGAGIRSRIGYGDKSGDTDNAESAFVKKVCLGMESLIARPKSGDHCKRKKDPSVVKDGGVKHVELGELALSVGDIGDASRDSCCGSSGGIPIGPMSCKNSGDDEGGYTSDLVDSSVVGQGSLVYNLTNDDWNHGVGLLDSSGVPDSQPRKLFEMNRCTRTLGNGNMDDGDDILKTCPCSFCIQATYIWSDLHYQDMKGRLAALKKSQKEARSLVNNYAKDKLSDEHSCRGPSGSTKLESDLTDQWRFLFHHMEDIFIRETSQLQSTFAMLKNMKEDCKIDLERIAGVPSDGH